MFLAEQMSRADDRRALDQDERPVGPLSAGAMFQLLVENVADVIVCGDASRRRTYVSPSCREVLGYEPEEMLGKHAYELLHPDDIGRVDAAFLTVGRANPCLQLSFRMRRKTGAYIWIEARYRHLPESDGIVAVLRDISAQKRAEEMLAKANAQLEAANRALSTLALQDGLTGLANRRRFDELLRREFALSRRQRRPLALVLIDCDYFKSYNDRYGHLAGDDCLRRVCDAAKGALRRPTDEAARYGGEEIALLLPATELGAAELVASDLRDCVAALGIVHETSPFGVATISAGVAAMAPRGCDGAPADLISAADRALYGAKIAGRNRVCVAAPLPL